MSIKNYIYTKYIGGELGEIKLLEVINSNNWVKEGDDYWTLSGEYKVVCRCSDSYHISTVNFGSQEGIKALGNPNSAMTIFEKKRKENKLVGLPKPIEKIYITKQNLIDLGWNNSPKYLNDSIVSDLNKTLKKYNITHPGHINHFMSQVMKESDNWNFVGFGDGVIEQGGTTYFQKYEPGTHIGKTLGNTQKGDGPLFRGSGYIHLTGRDNYTNFYLHLKKEGIDDTDVLSKGYLHVSENYPWEAAGWFWSTKKLNEISLKKGKTITKEIIKTIKQGKTTIKTKTNVTGNSTVFEVTSIVNGGYNGIEDRIKNYELIKKILNY